MLTVVNGNRIGTAIRTGVSVSIKPCRQPAGAGCQGVAGGASLFQKYRIGALPMDFGTQESPLNRGLRALRGSTWNA